MALDIMNEQQREYGELIHVVRTDNGDPAAVVLGNTQGPNVTLVAISLQNARSDHWHEVKYQLLQGVIATYSEAIDAAVDKLKAEAAAHGV